ncbi:lipid-A-disaccharide synthase [candidate division KSB1 bacterium]|nr:lipid-A-disaccharide synthase [candidate division KSB1 bacterium]
MAHQKIMLISGEASGDMHAAGLVRELKKLRSDIDIFGIGGDQLQEQGMDLVYHIRQMSVLGFGDVIKQFAFFRRVFKHIVSLMNEQKPDMIILIDYPGLNLKLAKQAKKRGIPVFFYIAPQVWAWGANRIPKMAKLIDRLGVIIPFEEPLFKRAGLQTEYVGHPLMEHLDVSISKNEFFKQHNLNSLQKIVGLLPGSRVTEVRRLLPEMMNTVTELKDVQVIISKARTVDIGIYQEILGEKHLGTLIENQTPEIMEYSDALLVASGTATLESALHETPLIVVYRVDPLSYWIGKRLVKIENIGLVNVIAGKRIVPEFIQNDFQAENVRPLLTELLLNDDVRQRITQDLRKVKEQLGAKCASENAARIAQSMLVRTGEA